MAPDEGHVSGIRLWNGDVCDLEVDAIVAPAPSSLWMTSGVAASIKQRGGHGIEFEAVARGPQPLGSAIVTGAGTLPCRYIIHAVTLGPDRHMSAAALDASTRAAVRLADSLGLHTLAFASLGSPLGGVPLADSAGIMVRALRGELEHAASLQEVVVAILGSRTYEAFQAEIAREQSAVVPVEPGAHASLVPVMHRGDGDDVAAETPDRAGGRA